jgi:dipeptidyl aminopeptidase/acylaminoacyl peptidase
MQRALSRLGAVGLLVAASASGCAIFAEPPPPPTSPAPRPAATARPAPVVHEATSDPSVLTAGEAAGDAALLPRATAVLAQFSNWDAKLTRAGAVVFTSDRDGRAQLYVGDAAHPDAAPTRLPSPAERVMGASLTADERAVVFVSDTGGDESFHVFRVGIDGSSLSDLTPDGTRHRGPPVVARAAPGVFAYAAHNTASAKTTIYLQTLDGTAPREVYADDASGDLADLSPDGKRALFLRETSAEDATLLEIDLATHKATRLYPPEGKPARLLARYSASADRVFVAADTERRAELVAITPRRATPATRYEEARLPHGAIADMLVSPAGDRVVLRVDGGDHDEIRVLDARTLELQRTIDAPLGAVTPSAFSRDGKRFTVTESHPDAPTDVYAVDAATGVVTPLRTDARPPVAGAALAASIEHVSAFEGTVLSTNVYLPADRKADARLRTIVLLHDGPAASAHLRYDPRVRFFAGLGYAIVEPNIRGSTGFGPEREKSDDREFRADAVRDLQSINFWARNQPWCDSAHMILMGTGYGGYVSLLALGRQATLWHAAVVLSATTDLRTAPLATDQARRSEDEVEFGVLGKDDDLLATWSPMKYVGAIASPVFVFQGARDPITPQGEAEQIVKALRDRSTSVEYLLMPEEGHVVARRADEAELLARVARFLDEHFAPR